VITTLVCTRQFLLCNLSSFAQDSRPTQLYAAPLSLNPALMGLNTNITGILSYRSQWGAIANGYTTSRFTILYPLVPQGEKNKLDMGLSAAQDQAGAFNTVNINFAISSSVQLGTSNYLTAALSGGFVQKSLDLNALTFDEQYVLGVYDAGNSTTETISNEKIMYPDFGFGLLYNYNDEESKINAYAGISIFHHNKPNQSFMAELDNLPMRFSFHGGVKIKSEGKFEFTPNIQVFKQGGAEESAWGLYTDFMFNEKMKLTSGLWYRYRNQNALAIMLGFEHKSFGLAYSYDMAPFGLSKLITASAMTHEITVNFKLDPFSNRDAPQR